MAAPHAVLEMVNLLILEPQNQAGDVAEFSEPSRVFEVPASLRATSPGSFQNKGLLLGLHNRPKTISESPTLSEALKFETARILHVKLSTKQKSWKDFAAGVVVDVNKARRSYSTSSARFTDEEIRDLLALDALFLVVLFMFCNKKHFFDEFKALDRRLEEITSTDKTDFFLVENQVPMYLLESVIRQLYEIDESRLGQPNFNLEFAVQTELEKILFTVVIMLNPFTFLEPLNRYLDHLKSTYPVDPLQKSLINCPYILDCLYRVICGHSLPFEVERDVQANLPLETIPSATRLGRVGIRVVGAVSSLTEVKISGRGYLKSARLQLPKVKLHDYSEAAFHNLALYEQLVSDGLCGDLRCYLQCMASLCVDVDDLQILTGEGIINNHLGNDSLQGMWDRTLKGVLSPYPSRRWVKCYKYIHQHRKEGVKILRTECWARFCSRPWLFLSVVAAIILLFLQGAQTWYTVFPRDRALPPSY